MQIGYVWTKNVREKNKSQGDEFIEVARRLGCDEDASAFDEIVKKVAKAATSTGRTGREAEGKPAK